MTRASPAARLLRRWHRHVGVIAAAFFAFLAVSGLLLNHGETFELASTHLGSPWLMAWYGLKPAVPEQGFQAEDMLFSWQGDTWVLGQRQIKPGHGEPVGAVRAAGQVWVATRDQIALYDSEGRLVDKIERELLPGSPIRRIGTRQGQLLINIGADIFATADGMAWERLGGDARIIWSRLQPLTEAQRRELAPVFAPSLSLQRIILDLHSGRIFGRYGTLITDALAAVLLLLAGSGLWMHFKAGGKRVKSARTAALPAHPRAEQP